MRWIAAFLALLALLSASPSVQAESDRLEWQVRYQSRTVRIHVIPPPGKPAPWPMAMVLHGASGLGRGHLIWPMADELAKRGVAAAVVRYYDGMSPRLRRKQSVHWFREREKILEHVTHALLARRAVKGPSIGVFGYSLGGFHAVAMAASDRRIAGAVALAGGLSGHLAGDLSR